LSELEFIGVPAYRYFWTFGDGATSTAQNPAHNYTSNGVYTVQLLVSDGVATVANNLTVNAFPPALGLAAGPGTLTLSWPLWATNFNLYAATNLTPPVTWSPVTNAVTNVSGVLNVTVPFDTGTRFFRLQIP
jgi:PKD repeat protein